MGWEYVLRGSCKGLVRDIYLDAEAYHDGEAVVSLDTLFFTLGFGVAVTPHLSFRGKVQVVVHDLTPLHEEQGSVLVQSFLFIQIAKNLVRDVTGLHMEGGVRLEESMLCGVRSNHRLLGTYNAIPNRRV